MAREKELYRDNLVRLDERFPGKELLNQKEASEFLGISLKKAARDLPFTRHRISKVKLASYLS